jgi:hypothetical protein
MQSLSLLVMALVGATTVLAPSMSDERHLPSEPSRVRAAPAMSQDTETQIKQVPDTLLVPSGGRTPEIGAPSAKADKTQATQSGTANCTGANAISATCYTATQQGRSK